MMAIDPTIQGLPYWDIRESTNKEVSLFTDAYFGAHTGVTDSQHQVVTGPFAYWPIFHASMADPSTVNTVNSDRNSAEIENASVNISSGIPTTMNVFGYLRNPVSFVSSRYLTRSGSTICGVHINYTCPDTVWDYCLETSVAPDVLSWYSCIEGRIHSLPHMAVAGSWRRSPTQQDNINCAAWYGHLSPPKDATHAASMAYPGSFINPFTLNCFYRPRNCTRSHSVAGQLPQRGTNTLRTQTTCAFRPRAHYCGPLYTGIARPDNLNLPYTNCARSSGILITEFLNCADLYT
jgi:hypothetical protein